MEPKADQIETYSLYQHQVSGKAPKLVTPDQKLILKCFIDLEYKFYQHFTQNVHVSHPYYNIIRFLPKFHGSIVLETKPIIQFQPTQSSSDINIWLQHVKCRYEKKNENNRFILMQNFLYGYLKPNILDIKIGGRSQKPKKITKSVQKYKVKLNGMLKTSKKEEKIFLSKYILNQITTQDQITDHIAYFFTEEGKLKKLYLIEILKQLQSLVLSFRSIQGWKFVSTSICIAFDSDQNPKVLLKYIDFGRAINNEMVEGYDQETSTGLQFIIKAIKNILENEKKFEGITIKKSDAEVIPKEKIAKFGGKSQKQIKQNQID